MAASARSNARTQVATNVLAGRLKQCWSLEFDWELIPKSLRRCRVTPPSPDSREDRDLVQINVRYMSEQSVGLSVDW